MTSEAIIPYRQAPTTEVQQIMRRIVADSSFGNYNNHNTNFVIWLYKNEELREETLRDCFLEKIYEAEREDSVSNRSPHHRRSAVRLVIKNALQNISKEDKTSCPIMLQKISFNLFSHYITTRKNKKGRYLSKTGYGQIRSAFVHLFRMSGQSIDDKFAQELSQFMGGLKRTVTTEKATSGESMEEGKKSMSLQVYKLFCKICYEGEGDD